MAKNSIDAYGAAGKTNTLLFDPDSLTLVEDPRHPLFDERVFNPPDPAMMASIDALGVIVGIIVNKNGETGTTEVVDGRQRVINARAVNAKRALEGRPLLKVPGTVQKDARRDGGKRLATVGFATNEVRRQDPPMIRAAKMARGADMGLSDEDLAVAFGCDVATVRNTMALLDSTRAVQDAVTAGQINITHARALCKLAPDEQRAKVAELVSVSADAKPHERARRQRAVLGADKPRMRTRRQIESALAENSGSFAAALRWVLGEDL